MTADHAAAIREAIEKTRREYGPGVPDASMLLSGLTVRDAEDVAAERAAARERERVYREALAEIESFPISGYHAGAAQRIAHYALHGEQSEGVAVTPGQPGDGVIYHGDPAGVLRDQAHTLEGQERLLTELAAARDEDAATRRVYDVLVRSYGGNPSEETEAQARRIARAALAATEEEA